MNILDAIAKYFRSPQPKLTAQWRSPRIFLRLGWALVASFLVAIIIAIAAPRLESSQAQNPNNYFSLRILHTNDHHAHLEPIKIGDRTLGGIARRRTLINQIRADNQQSNSITKESLLLLDAGDIFQGTLYFNQYLGQADLDFYNTLKYDAATLGNHEFDRGQYTLAEFIDKAKFPIVSANIRTEPDSPVNGKIKPWHIINLQGEKIGIFGLTTPDTAIFANIGAELKFTDPIAAARNAVRDLKRQNVNKIVALTHLGFDQDQQLARQVADIDIIIGGHTHTPVGNIPNAIAPYPLVVNSPSDQPVLIATDWEWGKYLGDLSVRFDAQGKLVAWAGKPQALDENVIADPEFVAKLQEYNVPIAALRKQVIGKSSINFDGDRLKLRTSETEIGNLITDAILAKTEGDGVLAVIINAGGIRSGLPMGDITMGDVLEAIPFGNTVTRIDLTGEQIKTALEHGVSAAEQAEGRFPQVSGIFFTWEPQAPVGKRIKKILIKDQFGKAQVIAPQSTYRIATNNFLTSGGDGYSVFAKGKNILDTGYLISDVVADYIKEIFNVRGKLEDRIVRS